MKCLVVTGHAASGKSFLHWHMGNRSKLYVFDLSLRALEGWEAPRVPVDAVVLDHFARGSNITDVATQAARWCEANDCPLIVFGQSGAALGQVKALLPDERVELNLERDYDTNRVRVSVGSRIETLSVDELVAKAFDLVGIVPAA